MDYFLRAAIVERDRQREARANAAVEEVREAGQKLGALKNKIEKVRNEPSVVDFEKPCVEARLERLKRKCAVPDASLQASAAESRVKAYQALVGDDLGKFLGELAWD